MQRSAGQHVFNIISEHHRRDGGEYAPVQATSPQQEAATSAMRSQSLPGDTGKIMTLQKGGGRGTESLVGDARCRQHDGVCAAAGS
jgi:hypothetical protein